MLLKYQRKSFFDILINLILQYIITPKYFLKIKDSLYEKKKKKTTKDTFFFPHTHELG